MDTLILTSLLVLMGISTFTSKELVIFCRVSKIGNVYGKGNDLGVPFERNLHSVI